MKVSIKRALSSVVGILLLAPASTVDAQQALKVVICKNNSSGGILLRNKKCKSGETKLSNISALTGTKGTDGADGSLRIYGDGSAGELYVTTGISLSDPNQQFTNCTITATGSLQVESGATIRCSGTFTNLGTLRVTQEAYGSATEANSGAMTVPARNAPAAAHVARPAGEGEFGSSSLTLAGGYAGLAYDQSARRAILKPGVTGGGPGGGGSRTSEAQPGGGSVTILAAGAISNEGTITAPGASPSSGNGTGGSAGGIIIIASKTSISNTGTISATGGNGSNSGYDVGAGGGGAGGIVHLLAPSVSQGTITVTGGTKGTSTTAVTSPYRTAGGGGGACGGHGGNGAYVGNSPTNTQFGAENGESGSTFVTLADPTSLF